MSDEYHPTHIELTDERRESVRTAIQEKLMDLEGEFWEPESEA